MGGFSSYKLDVPGDHGMTRVNRILMRVGPGAWKEYRGEMLVNNPGLVADIF